MKQEMQWNLKLVTGEVLDQNIFLKKCTQCGLCFPVCPDNAIPVGKDQKRTDFNYDYCKGCGVCAKICPFKAIEMVDEGEK